MDKASAVDLHAGWCGAGADLARIHDWQPLIGICSFNRYIILSQMVL